MRRLFQCTLFVSIILMSAIPVCGQRISLSNVKAQLDTMFANLDKTKVPAGFLWDTAVNLVEREEYNGTALTDSNCVSLNLMGDMLNSINSASVGADTIGVQAAIARLQRNSNILQQMVGILFQPYNYIVGNALTDNLIVYSNDRVSDSYIGGVWQNPYAEDVLFGFAVGKEAEVSLNTTFMITNIDSLSTRSFQSILFDPGDGGGFRSVAMGGTVVASYDDSGYYETRLKVTYGGHEYQSHGVVYVLPPPQNNTSASPSTISDTTFVVHYQGVPFEARVCYKTPRCFDHPLIIAEGFDPWRLLNDKEDHLYSGSTSYSSIHRKIDLTSFDVFYIDWYDYGADIRANAEVLKVIIRWVNDKKTSGNQNFVLGQSMGGLIARYALRDMELNNELHDTKVFISHDAPHSGANVSPGLLFAYRDLYDFTDNIVGLGYSLFGEYGSEFDELRRFGSYISVKQMLPNYVNSSWNYDNSVFNEFQTELADMGFPQGDPGSPIENIAIINGGRTSDGSLALFSAGDRIVDFHLCVSAGLLSDILLSWYWDAVIGKIRNKTFFVWIPGKSSLHFNYDVFPYLTNNSVVSKLKIVYKKKYLWIIEKSFTLREIDHYSPATGVPLDAVTCSTYSPPNPISLNSNQSSFWLQALLLDYTLSLKTADRLSFIPTASAFASTDFSRDFRANHPNPITQTPFTSYVLPDTTTEHISFFDSINYWLETIEDVNISGPILPEGGAVYSIPPAYASSFQWSTSNSSIATINSSGELSINGFGIVDVIATKENTNYVISKRKRVLAGLPRMALFANHSGTQWSVSAECIDEGVEEFISSSGLTDSLMRKWYLIINGVTVDSTFKNKSNSVMWCVADTVRNATVSLIISCGSRTTTPVFLTLKDNRNYLFNVYEIRTPGLFCIYEVNAPYIYDTDNPPYFKLTNNPDDPNTNTWPKRLKATAGNVIKRTYGDLTIIDNHLVWDLFSDPDIESLCSTGAISDITIDVYRDTIETNDYLVQTIVIPVVLFDPLEF